MSLEVQRASERLGREREAFNNMVTSGIRNPLVASALREVDRALFVPPWKRDVAYTNNAVQLGDGVSVSQPKLVATMLDNLGLDGQGRVLEIGTCLGYEAGLLSYCASEVITVENNYILVVQARDRLAKQGCTNVSVYFGDGALGLPQEAPYDSIVVSAAAADIPQALFDQLKNGGRIVLPLRKRIDNDQYMVVGVKDKDTLTVEIVKHVVFHPLVSDAHGGWNSDPSIQRRNFKLVQKTPQPISRGYFEEFLHAFVTIELHESGVWVESEEEEARRLFVELFGENSVRFTSFPSE